MSGTSSLSELQQSAFHDVAFDAAFAGHETKYAVRRCGCWDERHEGLARLVMIKDSPVRSTVAITVRQVAPNFFNVMRFIDISRSPD